MKDEIFSIMCIKSWIKKDRNWVLRSRFDKFFWSNFFNLRNLDIKNVDLKEFEEK